MTYIPQPTVTEGGTTRVSVTDDNLQQLFTDVLKELKKMNLQLQLLSDNEIKNTDIE
jgi:hypothetical protein